MPYADPKRQAAAWATAQARRRARFAVAIAERDALRAAFDMLVCLDVTSREGQRAFAEWRNGYARTLADARRGAKEGM